MSAFPLTAVEHDLDSDLVIGSPVSDRAIINLCRQVEPAPNQTIAIPLDGDDNAAGMPRLWTHLDVWSIPAISDGVAAWLVIRLSVTDVRITHRVIRATVPKVL
jgi:hypothetical protein